MFIQPFHLWQHLTCWKGKPPRVRQELGCPMSWGAVTWGQGSALGILAILGYVLFASGAILLWFNRPDVPKWVHDELSAVRRNLIRRAVFRPCRGLRAELACKASPTGFCRCLARPSRRKINRGAILMALGPLLFLLDFLI